MAPSTATAAITATDYQATSKIFLILFIKSLERIQAATQLNGRTDFAIEQYLFCSSCKATPAPSSDHRSIVVPFRRFRYKGNNFTDHLPTSSAHHSPADAETTTRLDSTLDSD